MPVVQRCAGHERYTELSRVGDVLHFLSTVELDRPLLKARIRELAPKDHNP